jgi:hypothetical protein
VCPHAHATRAPHATGAPPPGPPPRHRHRHAPPVPPRRLKSEPFECYFDGSRKLLPRPSDLSYFNWTTQTAAVTGSPNFAVLTDAEGGLLFKNKRDRKLVNPDPGAPPGDNTTRTEVALGGGGGGGAGASSSQQPPPPPAECLQAVLLDHYTRRKA